MKNLARRFAVVIVESIGGRELTMLAGLLLAGAGASQIYLPAGLLLPGAVLLYVAIAGLK